MWIHVTQHLFQIPESRADVVPASMVLIECGDAQRLAQACQLGRLFGERTGTAKVILSGLVLLVLGLVFRRRYLAR